MSLNMSDKSTASTTIERLHFGNYSIWKLRMKMILVERELWDAVMDENLSSSDKTSSKALAVMISAVDDEQLIHLVDCSTAYSAWKKLESIHESNDSSTKIFLLRKLLTLRLLPGSTMQQYIDDIKSTRHKLLNSGLSLPDEIITSLILIGLPTDYENLVIALETLGDELSYDYVITRLLHEERRRSEQKSSPSSSTSKHDSVLLTKTSSKHPIVRCSYCKKRNHTIEKCYKRIAEEKLNNQGHANIASTNELFFSAITTTPSLDNTWVIDSGATNHMCRQKDWFINLKDDGKNDIIHIGDGKVLTSTGKGDIPITLSNGKSAKITSVLYVPNLSTNLLSIKRLTTAGYNISFINGICNISFENDIVATANLSTDGLYHLNCSMTKNTEYANVITETGNIDLWHQRFGHTNFNTIFQLANSKSIKGINISSKPPTSPCETCVVNKQTRGKYPISTTKSTKPLEIIHSDVCGPMRTISSGGARYMVLFIDDYSRYTYIDFLTTKDQVFSAFVKYRHLVENIHESKIKALRTDGGGEYCSNVFQNYLETNGIIHQVSAPYTPEQNGIAERMNRTVIEMARCLLHTKSLPYVLWAEATRTAVYIRNRTPSQAIENEKTPYELWFKRPPTIDHLRVFGCLAYVHIPDSKRGKLEPKAIKTIFLGYYDDSKAWRLFDPISKTIIKSRDVIFDESATISLKPSISSTESSPCIIMTSPLNVIDSNNTALNSLDPNNNDNIDSNDHNDTDEEYHTDTANDDEVEPASDQPETSRRILPPRNRRPPVPVGGYMPGESYVAHVAIQDLEPTSYKEAMKRDDGDKWMDAAKEEYDSLIENKTWSLVPLPKGRNPISCRWIFRIKRKADGSLDKYKARLVARGFTQKPGIDFEETFAPVAKLSSIRLLLAIAAQENLLIGQMDVKTAYLQYGI